MSSGFINMSTGVWQPAPKPQPPEPEMVVGPIYGLRGWGLAPGGYLRSLGVAYTWEPTDNDVPARCFHGLSHMYGDDNHGHTEPPPRFDHGCGFYSLKPHAEIRHILMDYSVEAIGVVEIRGRVIEHEWGYRSEYAAPRLICVDFPRAHTVQKLYPDAEVRGVDCYPSAADAAIYWVREATE